MGELGPIVFRVGGDLPYAPLRPPQDDWGIRACDLVSPPRRLWADGSPPPPTVELAVDVRRLRSGTTPAQLLVAGPGPESWAAQTRRAVARLRALFLICEDKQRRLDARSVNTLAHQISLVRHVLENERLRRILIADEVGLGKTVEVGLILHELIAADPGVRILYLAPARLVRNVRRELDRLGLGFRQWTSYDRDATLDDPRVIASIHKATHGPNLERVSQSGPWNVLIVDEVHHLSDWAAGGGDPKDNYKLVQELVRLQPPMSRVMLLSGTPHQGHPWRFENLLRLLRAPDEDEAAIAGRVIYRTKEDVRDWDGNPLFPRRQVNEPTLFELSPNYRAWIEDIHEFYRPTSAGNVGSRRRAAGWRCAQALQWATSSPQAGLGYLARQAIRLGWTVDEGSLREALGALRPYRRGPADEPAAALYERIRRDVEVQVESDEIEDLEDMGESEPRQHQASRDQLDQLLQQGLDVLKAVGDEKWRLLESVLADAGAEKVVLFAQPIETVMALAAYLERTSGRRPALIIGGQTDAERQREIDLFTTSDEVSFLVSSRAGGEGINLQIARRLVHIDVPWNPMDLEQRVGRIHRFGSTRTIIVDTLVARGSREEEAYRVARQKLRLIVQTLVPPDRFEEIFSRVMSLVSSEDLQDLLLREPTSPMAGGDQEHLAQLVRQGFDQWKAFHDRYAGEQRHISDLDPGLAQWANLESFVVDEAGARAVTGFHAQRFVFADGDVEARPQPARVLTFSGEHFYACGDYAGVPVTGPAGETARLMGLNTPEVAETLRRLALAQQPLGAAHLRWPNRGAPPARFPFGILMFLRQSLRSEQATWIEISSDLHCFVVTMDGTNVVEARVERQAMFDAIFHATVRVRPEDAAPLVDRMRQDEGELLAQLRRTRESDAEERVRHAVTPVFAAVVGAPGS